MGSIVVLGSLNMDMVIRTDRLPQPGETVLGSGFQTVPGGKGANQAVAAARLGGHGVTMAGKVGADDFGQSLCNSLVQGGVCVEHVGTDPDTATGMAWIAVEDSGQNQIIVYPGANGRLSPVDVDDLAEVIAGAKVLIMQLEVPVATVVHALMVARQSGTLTILNPAPAVLQPGEWLADVDYLVPNESEAAHLVGAPVATDEQAGTAARRLRDLGARHVIVTRGDKGVVWCGPDGAGMVPAYPVRAVDVTAAGDAFVAALAVGLVAGQPLTEALHWGCAAGAIAVTRSGAQPSLPTRSELETFVSELARS